MHVPIHTECDYLGTKMVTNSRKIQINLVLPFPRTVIFLGKARRTLFYSLLLPLLPGVKPGLSLQAHWSWNLYNISSINLRHECQTHSVAEPSSFFKLAVAKLSSPNLALNFDRTGGLWTWPWACCTFEVMKKHSDESLWHWSLFHFLAQHSFFHFLSRIHLSFTLPHLIPIQAPPWSVCHLLCWGISICNSWVYGHLEVHASLLEMATVAAWVSSSTQAKRKGQWCKSAL